MKNHFLIFLLSCSFAFSQSPLIQWQLFNNSNQPGSQPNKAISTSDNGYLILSSKIATFGTTNCNLLKLDTNGSIVWEKSIGGSNNDDAVEIIQINDGGYILIASTQSNNGDVSGNHNDGFGNAPDVWVVKLNNLGIIEWQNCYGGSSSEKGTSIKQTTDGGYIFTASVESNDGDINGLNHGNSDYWVVKINSLGAIEWHKCFGGTNRDEPREIIQTADGGYVVIGDTYSINGDVTLNHGLSDYWIVKINNLGILQWQKSLGGQDHDPAKSIAQTLDGGFIVGGGTYANNGDFNSGGPWILLKLDNSGNIISNKSFYGSVAKPFSQMKINPSNNHIYIIGSNYTYANQYNTNIEIDHLDQDGNFISKIILGGSAEDFGTSIDFASDNGLIILGDARSQDGDIISNYNGNYNKTWIAKISSQYLSIENFIFQDQINLYPNPVKDVLHINSLNFYLSKIEIYDNLGRIVINELNSTNEINLSNLTSGVYLVNLINKNGEIVKKTIIKE